MLIVSKAAASWPELVLGCVDAHGGLLLVVVGYRLAAERRATIGQQRFAAEDIEERPQH